MSNCRDVSLSRFRSRMMFSPKVLNEDPWAESILMTLFVRGVMGLEAWFGDGSCAETMYCSFRMSWVRDQLHVLLM